jgi:hypothetical protein
MEEMQRNYDVSVHIEEDKPKGSGFYSIVTNSLADLTMRHNRVGHRQRHPVAGNALENFPYEMESFPLFPADDLDGDGIADPATRHARRGEDVVLSHVISFDIRVFDPAVPVMIRRIGDVEEALLPGDPGYQVPDITTNPPRGGFVDLFYGRLGGGNFGPYFNNPQSRLFPQFAGEPHRRSQLQRNGYRWATYDTWSLQYEFDGINQDGDANTDEETIGLGYPERETSPPYPFPLRGIQISLRVLDPDSRQVRQMTVVNDFTPE